MPEVLILSGPAVAGKSSVAQALADRYDRVAHIQVEVLRGFVTPTGFAKHGQPEYERQRHLAARNACALARNFLAERFGVIIEDVLDEPELLAIYLRELRGLDVPVHLVQLLPSLAVSEAREMERRRGKAPAGWVRAEYERYAANAASLPGVSIDSSALTANETADKVQALTTSGESLIMARPEV